MIRTNTALLGAGFPPPTSELLDEDVKHHLLELGEELHDEKREALAVFNNKVESHRLHAAAPRDRQLAMFA
jgi:hypothetical protein